MKSSSYRHGAASEPRRGTATIGAALAVVTIAGLSGSMLMVSHRSGGEHRAAVNVNKATAAAKSAVAAVMNNMSAGVYDSLGSQAAPIQFGDGRYWADVVPNGSDTYTVTATGIVRSSVHTIEVVLASSAAADVFENAMFAGNQGADGQYTLEFGGTGAQADEINGSVYSGQDLAVVDDATVSGSLRAAGSISGGSGDEGEPQSIPDLGAMDYENVADFDVAAMFQSGSSYSYDSAGGSAWQMPPSSPAHIFRKNPSDRSTEYQGTDKDDFFLEDPYETVTSDPAEDGSDAYKITLDGDDGEQKVYYVDGNLWIHNRRSRSLKLQTTSAESLRVTFVVRGNIYFSDNLFYGNENTDAALFIAMKDDTVQDSGNIYFGDPIFGTLVEMNAYMYAENNFYDTNLDSSGSSTVTVNGLMSAGNQVLIDRDYGSSHTKLIVNYDDRIATGLEMPGVPVNSGTEKVLNVLSRRRVANSVTIFSTLDDDFAYQGHDDDDGNSGYGAGDQGGGGSSY